MSNTDNSGFGKFVPGFDFLQNLAKGASNNIPQMPNLGNWVAPTLNVDELERRIDELKAVHFWLEQNSRALGATIQALEVQKMTLSTLKGMNFNIGDVANALKLKAAESVHQGVQRVTEQAASTATSAASSAASAANAIVDPMQLWGSLTEQFQQIAASAFKDVAKSATQAVAQSAVKAAAKPVAKTAAKTAAKSAAKPTAKAATTPAPRKAAAKKS